MRSLLPTSHHISAPARIGRLGILLGIAACLALLVQYIVMSVGFVRDTPGGLASYVLRPDFIVSVTGAEILLHGDGERLYDQETQRVAEEGALHEGARDAERLLGFNHPPFAAIVVAALRLTGLPYSAIFLVWTLLRLAAIVAALWALSRAWPIRQHSLLPARYSLLTRSASGLLCALVALTFYPVTLSLQVGQTTPFVLLGWAAGSTALRSGNDTAGGAWLALAVLKPQYLPVPLIALVVMRRWRALRAFAISVGAAVLLSMPFAGWDWPWHYVKLLWRQAMQPPNQVIDPAMMQNWRGFFMRVLNFAPNAALYAALASALTVLAVIVVWYFAQRQKQVQSSRFKVQGSATQKHLSGLRVSVVNNNSLLTTHHSLLPSNLWAFTLCAALLASYHLLYPDLSLAIVPGWIIAAMALARPFSNPARWAWLGWLWVGWGLGFIVNYQSMVVALAPAWLAITSLCLVAGASRAALTKVRGA
jgi:hypothetical protein